MSAVGDPNCKCNAAVPPGPFIDTCAAVGSYNFQTCTLTASCTFTTCSITDGDVCLMYVGSVRTSALTYALCENFSPVVNANGFLACTRYRRGNWTSSCTLPTYSAATCTISGTCLLPNGTAVPTALDLSSCADDSSLNNVQGVLTCGAVNSESLCSLVIRGGAPGALHCDEHHMPRACHGRG